MIVMTIAKLPASSSQNFFTSVENTAVTEWSLNVCTESYIWIYTQLTVKDVYALQGAVILTAVQSIVGNVLVALRDADGGAGGQFCHQICHQIQNFNPFPPNTCPGSAPLPILYI